MAGFEYRGMPHRTCGNSGASSAKVEMHKAAYIPENAVAVTITLTPEEIQQLDTMSSW